MPLDLLCVEETLSLYAMALFSGAPYYAHVAGFAPLAHVSGSTGWV